MADPSTALDAEITTLRAQITHLRTHLTSLSTTLLSSPSLPSTLALPRPHPSAQRPHHRTSSLSAAALATRASAQRKRNAENVYRACAGVTAFRVQDPDPCAVDGGRVLGVRVDFQTSGRGRQQGGEGRGVEGARFGAEGGVVVVMFQRVVRQTGPGNGNGGKNGKNVLRIYKHTVPACIPLQQLANKWMPVSSSSPSSSSNAAQTSEAENEKQGREREKKEDEQNLVRFGRALRRELVSWHMRVEAVAKLRRDAGLPPPSSPSSLQDPSASSSSTNKPHNPSSFGTVLNAFTSDSDSDSSPPSSPSSSSSPSNNKAHITAITADAAARELEFTWSDRRVGIVRVGRDGGVEKAVVRRRDGVRDSGVERRARGGRVEGLVGRMMAVGGGQGERGEDM